MSHIPYIGNTEFLCLISASYNIIGHIDLYILYTYYIWPIMNPVVGYQSLMVNFTAYVNYYSYA